MFSLAAIEMRFFILFFISALFFTGGQTESFGGDSLSDDEAAIALHIKALHDEDSETRASAAAALRLIIAKYPSGTSNIRSWDSGEAGWMEKVNQVTEGMTKAEVVKILPAFMSETDFSEGPTGDISYRLDNNWLVVIPFRREDKVISSAKLIKRERLILVAPPAKHTGSWITWYVNGQKADESQYEDGQYNGLCSHYYDNGQKSYEQNSKNHDADGPSTGWYKDGQIMYSGQYRKGKLDGKWIHWFPNGNKAGENNYKDGEYHGLIASWYENGQTGFENNYKNGVKHGIEAGWDEQGVLHYRREYQNARLLEAPIR